MKKLLTVLIVYSITEKLGVAPGFVSHTKYIICCADENSS